MQPQEIAAPAPASVLTDEARGLWLGLLGVLIFALTLPMTRLAVGPAADPQLPPLFVTAGRAAVAGLLSIGYLLLTAAPSRGARSGRRLRSAPLARWSAFRSSSVWPCARSMQCMPRW